MVRKSKRIFVKTDIYQTEDANVKCTKLPEFIRAKKYLGAPFCVYFANQPHLEGVYVTVLAGNYKNPNAELKNNQSVIKNGIAEFQDLRFLGKSGRGTKFNVYIKLETHPPRIITYFNAIKVTVDGPRPPRTLKPKVQQAIEKSEEFLKLKRKYENELFIERFFEKSNLPQASKKRFKQRYFLETNLDNQSSYSSSPAVSPVSVSSYEKCTCYFCVSIESYQNSPNETEPTEAYKNLVYNYLKIYIDLYKIKINQQLLDFLVDLVIKKANTMNISSSIASDFSYEYNSAHTCTIEEEFLYNFQLFYANLIQDYGKTNLKNNCSLNFSS